MDWLINRKIKFKKMAAFVFVFLIQYVFKPTQLIFLYPLASPGTTMKVDDLVIRDIASLLQNLLSIETLSRSLGTVWNLFFPTIFQTEYFFFLSRNLPAYLSDKIYLFLPLPAILLSTFIVFIFRKKSALLIFLIASYIWTIIVSKTSQFSLEQISVVNGGILLLLFLFVFFIYYRQKFRYFVFCIFMIISTVGLVILFNSNSILESDHRYLFPAAIVPSLLAPLLINGKKIGKAFVFFVITVTFLHFTASIYSQNEFTQNYSRDSKKFFAKLQNAFGNVEQKAYISLEGANKEISLKMADSMRVGAMPSEASIAVHLNKRIDSIVLLDDTSQAIQILDKGKDKNSLQFYRFIYDGNLLKDISEGFREGLNNPMNIVKPKDLNIEVTPASSLVGLTNQMVNVKTTYYHNEGYTLGIYPNVKFSFGSSIPSQLPLKVRMKIAAKVDTQVPIPYLQMHYAPQFVSQPNIWKEVISWRKGECVNNKLHSFECIRTKDELLSLQASKIGEIRFIWEYDTYGSVGKDKFHEINVNFDGIRREYTFIIPSGGEYLKSLSIEYISLPSFIEISDITFSLAR